MKTRTILIGVRDDGRILGLTFSATTFEEWAQKMHSIHVDAIRKHPGVPPQHEPRHALVGWV